jgi:hypothetical protein
MDDSAGGGMSGGGEGGARLEGSDVVFQTRTMNEHLICSLCMGYLREATTVTECLHTCELDTTLMHKWKKDHVLHILHV